MQERLTASVSSKITPKEFERLDALCVREGVPRGFFIRLVLRAALDLAERGEIKIPKARVRRRASRRRSPIE